MKWKGWGWEEGLHPPPPPYPENLQYMQNAFFLMATIMLKLLELRWVVLWVLCWLTYLWVFIKKDVQISFSFVIQIGLSKTLIYSKYEISGS